MDYSDTTIDCKRDLEDFARLQLQSEYNQSVIAPADITYYFMVSGIKVFEAVNLTDSYLENVSAAATQKNASFVQSAPGWLSATYFKADNNKKAPFIFEGCNTGFFYPTITICYKGYPVASKSLTLNLHPISWFWNPPDATNDRLIFVHGWNMEEWEKDKWADTTVKRLYWQGYRGKFYPFKWDTETGFNSYNASEVIAWNSGFELRNWINFYHNQGETIHLLAHSMGNVAAGEALRLLPSYSVQTYIASQAAVAAHCYDNNCGTYKFIADTPDLFGHFWNGSGSPYLVNNLSVVANRVNFYNERDYALREGHIGPLGVNWVSNNDSYRPDWIVLYSYHERTGSPNEYNPPTDTFEHAWSVLNIGGDTFEIFGRCVQARSYPLGSVARSGFPNALDLQTIGFDETHYSHSKQFRSYIAEMWGYWNQVMTRASLPDASPTP